GFSRRRRTSQRVLRRRRPPRPGLRASVDDGAPRRMNWEAWATVAVAALIFYLLVSNAAAPDVSLGIGAGALMTLGLLSSRLPSAHDVASAFGNEALLTIA